MPSHTLLLCTPSLFYPYTHVSDSDSPSDSYRVCDSHLEKLNVSIYPARHHVELPNQLNMWLTAAHTHLVRPSSFFVRPRGRCSCCTCQRPITYQARQSNADADRRPQGQHSKEWRRAQITASGEDTMDCGLIDGIIIDSDTASLRWMDTQIPIESGTINIVNVSCR